jgi:hypothetical protein
MLFPCSFLPVAHSLECQFQVPFGRGLRLLRDAVKQDDFASYLGEEEYPILARTDFEAQFFELVLHVLYMRLTQGMTVLPQKADMGCGLSLIGFG